MSSLAPHEGKWKRQKTEVARDGNKLLIYKFNATLYF